MDRRAKQKFIWDYKLEHPCEICSEADPRCLVFHHLGDKKYGIAAMPTNGFSIEKILAEIQKCVVWCANCHTKHHAVEGRNPNAPPGAWVLAYAESLGEEPCSLKPDVEFI